MIIRIGKNCIKVLLVLVGIVMAAAGTLAVRLSMGPIPIAWATPWIEHAMQSEGGIPSVLAAHDMALAWNSETRRIEFTAHDVSVTQGATRLTAVQQIGVTFSLVGLLEGRLQLKDLTLIAPHFVLSMDAPGPGGNNAPAPTTFLTDDTKALINHLHSITIEGGVVELLRAGSDVRDVMNHIQVKWSRDLWLSGGSFMADLQFAGDQTASPLRASLQETQDGIEVTAHVDRMLPNDVQFIVNHKWPGLLPQSLSLDRLKMPLGMDAKINLTPSGGIEHIDATINADAGTVILPEYYDAPLPLAATKMHGTYDAPAGNWQIDPVNTAITDANGAIPFSLSVDGNQLQHNIHLSAGLQNMSIAQLKRWWPKGAAPGAIEWINDNVKDGKIPQLNAAVYLHAADGQNYVAARAEGGFEIQNGTSTFLPTMPAVTGIDVKATITDLDHVHFDIDKAHLDDITILPGSTMDVTGLGADTQILKMNIQETAQLPTMLKLLDRPPYGYVKKMGLDAASATGGVGLDLKMEFPLLATLKVSDIQYHAIANLSQVGLPNALMNKDITAGQGVLDIDPEHLKITGQADIAGVPMEFTWQDFMAPKDSLTRQVQFASELMDDDHARLNLPTAGRVTGSTKLTGTYEVRSGASSLSSQMDFRDAAVKVDEVSYQKPVGVPLVITTDMTMGDQINFKVTGAAKDVSVSGGGILDANFNPVKLDFPTMKIGNKSDAQIAFEKNGAQQRITLSGNSFDIGQLLTAPPNTPKQATPPRNFQVRLGTLFLANNMSMKNLQADMDNTGQGWDKIILHGNLQSKTPVDVNWDVTAPGHKLSAHTVDAGGVLSAMGGGDAMIGGDFTLDGTSDAPNKNSGFTGHGNITIKNFRLREVPLLGRLVAAVSPGELLSKIRGKDGVGFDTLKAQFEYSGDLLRLRAGKMNGDSLGLTFEGDVNQTADPSTVVLSGTIVPLYAVNGVMSGIPILGDIINGKDGGGLLGFNYTAKGAITDPSVSVSTLSGLAPGFLRDLFFGNSSLPEKSAK